MKSYNEMVDSLFSRKAHYDAKRKQNLRVFIGTGSALCCVCAVALLCFALTDGGAKEPPVTMADAIYPGIKDTFDELNGESMDNPAANNKIVVNQISNVTADRQSICLWLDDFVRMDKTQLNEYYGINVFPQVPGDIPEWDDQVYGIYKRDGGTGEVYWDCMVLNYANEDFTRKVNLEFQKDTLPVLDYVFLNGAEEKSVINNVEVMIGLSENGRYYGEFMYQNVGFCVNATGVTQDEFVDILSSIIQ